MHISVRHGYTTWRHQPVSQSVSSAHTDRLVVRRISQTAAGRSSEDPGEGETWLASERAR